MLLFDLNGLIPKTKEYFVDTVHYADKGSRFVALSLADYIQNKAVTN